MPIQIIEENRRPSFRQQLGSGISKAIDFGSQIAQQERQNKVTSQENEVAKQMGFDLSGITDPKTRQQMFGLAMQGGNQQQLEMLKQQGKQQQIGQKQDFLSNLFGGGQDENQGQQEQQGNQESNAMAQQFDPSQLSDSDILKLSAMDPVLGREARLAKDSALKKQRAEREFEFKERRASPEHKREERVTQAQAQADVKYNQSLQESQKLNELKEKTLDRLEKLNMKGVTGKPYEKILEKSGLINLTSEGRREFAADVKNLITDIRSILGGQFSNFEFQTILNAYPSADFSKEANKSIINNLKEFQDIKKKEFEVANQLKKENKGKIPEDFQSRVNEKVHEYAISRAPEIKKNTQKILAEEYGITPGNILMLDGQGEPLDVPEDQVSYYESLGASLP